MSKNEIVNFFSKLCSDSEIFLKVSKLREKYGEKILSEKESYDFMVNEIVPFANQMGYDFTVEDFYNNKNGTLLSEDSLMNISGGVGAINKKLLSLGLCGLSVFSTVDGLASNMPGSVHAAPGDKEGDHEDNLSFEKIVHDIEQELKKITSTNVKKEVSDVKKIVKSCKGRMTYYISATNMMFKSTRPFNDFIIPEATSVNEVASNFMSYIKEARRQIKEHPEMKKVYKMDIDALLKYLDEWGEVQEDLIAELNEKYQILKNKINPSPASEDDLDDETDDETVLDGLMSSINAELFRSSNLGVIFRQNAKLIDNKNAIINEEEVNKAIRIAMKRPNEKNISKLVKIYESTVDACKLNIYRHLGILSNRGNPYAFLALERSINKKSSLGNFSYYEAEDVEDLEGEISEYNEKLNENFEKCMNHLFGEDYSPDISKGDKDIGMFPVSCLGSLETEDQIYRKDLLRIRRKFKFGKSGFWLDYSKDIFNSKRIKFGWKLHVSAQPQSAAKIASIVIPYLKENDIDFKMCLTLDALRNLNGDSNYTQQGKFIAIYTKNPEQAKRVSNDLDELISDGMERGELKPCDFCELLGDAKIGNTGALYARLGAFEYVWEGLNDRDARKVPVNKFIAEKYPEFKKSPFDLPVSFLGMELNNKSEDVYKEWAPKVSPVLSVGEVMDKVGSKG